MRSANAALDRTMVGTRDAPRQALMRRGAVAEAAYAPAAHRPDRLAILAQQAGVRVAAGDGHQA